MKDPGPAHTSSSLSLEAGYAVEPAIDPLKLLVEALFV
jgi:hypothetical protein